MNRVVCTGIALLLLLNGCSVQTLTPATTESFTQGIYEFTFSVEQISGEPTNEWDFVYTYNGEIITSGHKIIFSLEIFTFHSIQVDIVEKGAPSNTDSTTFRVAICNGGSGKTEITVTDTNGKTASFNIVCTVAQIGKK